MARVTLQIRCSRFWWSVSPGPRSLAAVVFTHNTITKSKPMNITCHTLIAGTQSIAFVWLNQFTYLFTMLNIMNKITHLGPFYWHGFTLIPAWISHHLPGKIWDAIVVYNDPQRYRVLLWWPLEWRHYRHDGVSNHQPQDCLLNRLFWHRTKRTSKIRVSGLYAGNLPVTCEFPA